MTMKPYLPAGMPAPVPAADGLDAPYWEAARQSELVVQRCNSCGTWQWGPEWLCHHCHSFDMGWEKVSGDGIIFSWEKPWHPVHGSLKGFGPYSVVLVELPDAGNVRMVGNLMGPPNQEISIGSPVKAVFEAHNDVEFPYTLVQWALKEDS